jgi:DNA replication and repair protein RecF
LTITQFKNYESGKFSFSERLNFIEGLNGMGQTNLLDAIYYCCMTKSYFHGRDILNVKKGESFFRLEATVLKNNELHRVIMKVIPGNVKQITLDATDYDSISQHIGFLPVIMLAPKDVDLVMGLSRERRRLIDSTISQIDRDYLENLMTYNRLLGQRNSLLKQSKGLKPDSHLLDTFTQKMAPLARMISDNRARMIDEMQESVKTAYHQISGGLEIPEIRYSSELQTDDFVSICRRNESRDFLLCRTCGGVHRDDLIFSLDGLEMRKFASQGQIKSFLVALNVARFKMIHSVTGIKPLLILDDIFGKLDPPRSRQLVQMLSHPSFGQVFIADASKDRVRSLCRNLDVPYRVFPVFKGQFMPVLPLNEEE